MVPVVAAGLAPASEGPGEATAGVVAMEPMTTVVDTRSATRRAMDCVRARRNRPVTTVTLTTVARANSGRKGPGSFGHSLIFSGAASTFV